MRDNTLDVCSVSSHGRGVDNTLDVCSVSSHGRGVDNTLDVCSVSSHGRGEGQHTRCMFSVITRS